MALRPMIVTCTGCNTRFRVPEGRIGPKGARIRCSRCKAVFKVSAPSSDPGFETPSVPLPPPSTEADPFKPPSRAPRGPDGDPFAGHPLAAPPHDPFAVGHGSAGGDDPFRLPLSPGTSDAPGDAETTPASSGAWDPFGVNDGLAYPDGGAASELSTRLPVSLEDRTPSPALGAFSGLPRPPGAEAGRPVTPGGLDLEDDQNPFSRAPFTSPP